MWPSTALLDLLGIQLPIIQAPMAGAADAAMAIAVSQAGALGSLPCAMLDADGMQQQLTSFRQNTNGLVNLNFFCHAMPEPDAQAEAAWMARLADYYTELGAAASTGKPAARLPFDEDACSLVEQHKPAVVSFHFGLPAPELLARVKAAGCLVLSSATTVAEAVWLEARGCDAIIAQGYEAGGHRGMFLTDDIASQPGTFALVPQVVDAVDVPVIAAGGIADGRGIAAAFALGAAGVQIGTAYLKTAQALITPMHAAALAQASDDQTALTNLFSGRPARGLSNRLMREVGPLSPHAPAFPTAGNALAPLKKVAEQQGSADFSSLWAGQAAALGPAGLDAGELTAKLAEQAERELARLNPA